MKRIGISLFIIFLGVGSWWLWENSQQLYAYVENHDFITLEVRYTPEQIIEKNRKDLLIDEKRTVQNAELKFYPHLYLDVKFTDNEKKPRESIILWSLVDGEMVLNTDTWEKTHGFEDAINAKATKNDFKILNSLAKKNGLITIDQLQKELHLDRDVLDPWIQSTLQKHLIIQRSHELILHFQNPKILVTPQTKVTQSFVSKPYNHQQRIPHKYTPAQIKNIAHSAFGDDFTIRKSHEIFLPIYNIEVLNPDGSILATYWNALTAQRMHFK